MYSFTIGVKRDDGDVDTIAACINDGEQLTNEQFAELRTMIANFVLSCDVSHDDLFNEEREDVFSVLVIEE
jgi:hypothetical protein